MDTEQAKTTSSFDGGVASDDPERSLGEMLKVGHLRVGVEPIRSRRSLLDIVEELVASNEKANELLEGVGASSLDCRIVSNCGAKQA